MIVAVENNDAFRMYKKFGFWIAVLFLILAGVSTVLFFVIKDKPVYSNEMIGEVTKSFKADLKVFLTTARQSVNQLKRDAKTVDIDKLPTDSLSSYLSKFIENEKGTINIENELVKSRTDLFININKEKANLFGVPIHEIDKTIRTAITGMSISKFRNQDGEEYNIVMRLPFEDEIRMSDFEKIYVKSMSGKLIPLRQLASIEFKKAPSLITRYNLSRTALITADLEKGANLDEIMNPVIHKLNEYPFPNGYTYRIAGELESRDEAFGGMKIAMIIALIAIFAVLVLQFRSFTQPLIIFTAIPLALIGSIWALFITGNTFSFAALIGLLSLIGIVINNSIILVDYTNRLRNDGKSIIEALKIAGEIRFTPIILTTLTTIGGLLPLTLRGGTMWAPMGWTIIGGLLVSTMLTLIIVPVLYNLFSGKVN